MEIWERHALFPRYNLTTFCQCALLKSDFELLTYYIAHTPASCKILAKAPENEQWMWRLRPRHTLSISGQGLSDHHYRLHSVRLCVELQSFAILWGNQGIWHWLSSRTGQSKYTVSTCLQPLIIFSLAGQDKIQARRQRRDCINGCCSDHVAVISGH